jgi:hypothetical protein
MKKILSALFVGFALCLPAFAHEDLHDFEVTLTVRGAPVIIYKVNQVPHRLADVLCSTLTDTVKAWKNSPTTDPLILEGTSGKITLFEKSVVDSVHCKDITPQKEHKPETKVDKKCWKVVTVPHCGSFRCSTVKYVYVYE